jgi:hypothetical protein
MRRGIIVDDDSATPPPVRREVLIAEVPILPGATAVCRLSGDSASP